MQEATQPKPSWPQGRQEEDWLSRALMHDTRITRNCIEHSARARLDDFHALYDLIVASPAFAHHHDAWHRASLHLDQLSHSEQGEIAASPLFRGWLHGCGRALIETGPGPLVDDLLRHVGNYCVGISRRPVLPLAARHGVIETWDCLRGILRLGKPDEFVTEKEQLELQALPVTTLPGTRVAVRNDLPGLRVALDESRVPERMGTVLAHQHDARYSAYPEGDFPVITQAGERLASVWPEAFADLCELVKVIVPRCPPPGWRMEGFSLSSMQGAVWINPCDELTVFESLVHETHHIKLRYLEEAVPLLRQEQTEERFEVGWRTDKRPIVGIYEGVFVHLHSTIALSRLVRAGLLSGETHDRGVKRVHALLFQARDGLALLQRHARMTPAGERYLDWAATLLSTLEQEALPRVA